MTLVAIFGIVRHLLRCENIGCIRPTQNLQEFVIIYILLSVVVLFVKVGEREFCSHRHHKEEVLQRQEGNKSVDLQTTAVQAEDSVQLKKHGILFQMRPRRPLGKRMRKEIIQRKSRVCLFLLSRALFAIFSCFINYSLFKLLFFNLFSNFYKIADTNDTH